MRAAREDLTDAATEAAREAATRAAKPPRETVSRELGGRQGASWEGVRGRHGARERESGMT